MRPEVVRRVAPLGVAMAVLAVVGIVWLAGRAGDPAGVGPGGGGTTDLARLKLSSWVAPGETVADPRYRLAPGADLPDGPRESAVFTLEPQPERRAALAAALGSAADRLTVQPDGGWGLGGVVCAEPGGDTPVSSPAELGGGSGPGASGGSAPGASGGGTSSSTGGSVAGSGGSAPAHDCPAPVPPGGSGDPLAVARPVLEAAGLGNEHIAVDNAGSGGPAIVRVDPRVDGLPTDGWTTWLEVSGSEIVSAQGWLTSAERGPAYPLVSARSAYQEFVRTPHPMPMIACPEPAPQDGDLRLMCGGPVVVTGATFGLSLQQSDGGPLLVPSWLFSVKGATQPVVQVAVEPRLLVQGTPGSPYPAPGGMERGTATAKPPPDSVAPYPTMPAN